MVPPYGRGFQADCNQDYALDATLHEPYATALVVLFQLPYHQPGGLPDKAVLLAQPLELVLRPRFWAD